MIKSKELKCYNKILLIGVLMCTINGVAAAPARSKQDFTGLQYKHTTANETLEERDQRMEWFRKARFGLFIHWGAYSRLGGEYKGRVSENGEWVQSMLNIPTSEYQELVKTFNPVKYDPKEWAQLFKDAGLKYICITTKHHDGFCLWDSKVNDDWDMGVTPYKKDLLAPLAREVRKQDMTFCIYHSILDWHHPLWPGRWNDLATGETDKERYTKEYLYPQLKELFTQYGDIGMIWFDGTWGGDWESEDGKKIEEYTRSLQPSVIINNRSGHEIPQPKYDFQELINNRYGFQVRGDYITPERDVPPVQMPGMDWETCQTMWDQNTWGYHRLAPYRSTKELLHLLIDIVAKGGNLLLNVGPTAEGEIPVQAKELLLNMGKWLDVNGEAIYGTTASPIDGLPFPGRCTQKGSKIYLHVYDWPVDQLIVPLKNKASKAYLLADPQADIKAEQGPGFMLLTLPPNAPDPIASVIALEIEGDVQASDMDQLPAASTHVYTAEQAKLVGIPCDIKLEEIGGVKSIGDWADASDWVEWTIDLKQESEYEIILDQACQKASAGSKMELSIAGKRLDFSVSGTGDDGQTFKAVKVGNLRLPSGQHTVVLKARNKTGESIIHIRSLTFEPVTGSEQPSE